MTRTLQIVSALAAVSFLVASVPATAQTSTGDNKPVVKKTSVKHHARKAAAPKVEYLRAAGSEPAPKAAK